VSPIAENIMDRSVRAEVNQIAERGPEKGNKLALGHLSRSHQELPMLDRSEARDVAIYSYVVRRIADHHLCVLTEKQMLERRTLSRISAKQPVRTDFPEIAYSANRGCRFVKVRQLVGLAIYGIRLSFLKQKINFSGLKACQRGIEFQVAKKLEFTGEQQKIPVCGFGEPIVCDEIGANLHLSQVVKTNRRHVGEPKQLRGLEPRVPRDHSTDRIDQNWNRESERLNASGDLPNLPSRVFARISLIRSELIDSPVLHLQFCGTILCLCLHGSLLHQATSHRWRQPQETRLDELSPIKLCGTQTVPFAPLALAVGPIESVVGGPGAAMSISARPLHDDDHSAWRTGNEIGANPLCTD
jgi:hypothetical protein